MLTKLSAFLLGCLVVGLGAVAAAVVLRRMEEWDDVAEWDEAHADAFAQEAPPLRHSVVDPRLDQRLPTMAKPPEQP
jgi:hypothetical protein